MAITVNHHNAFALVAGDDLVQCIGFCLVDFHGLTLCIVYSSVCKLQQLVRQCRGRYGGDVRVSDAQHKLFLHLAVSLQCFIRQLHLNDVLHQRRQGQIVLAFHTDADVTDFAEYLFVSTGTQIVAVYDISALLPGAKIPLAILRQCPAEALAAIEEIQLTPKIHQTIRGRRPGEKHNALDQRPHLSQRLESL